MVAARALVCIGGWFSPYCARNIGNLGDNEFLLLTSSADQEDKTYGTILGPEGESVSTDPHPFGIHEARLLTLPFRSSKQCSCALHL